MHRMVRLLTSLQAIAGATGIADGISGADGLADGTALDLGQCDLDSVDVTGLIGTLCGRRRAAAAAAALRAVQE